MTKALQFNGLMFKCKNRLPTRQFQLEVNGKRFVVSTDFQLLQFDVIHEYLTQSYWCRGISKKIVRNFCQYSLCFGMYKTYHENTNDNQINICGKNQCTDTDALYNTTTNLQQVGFARLITDYCT